MLHIDKILFPTDHSACAERAAAHAAFLAEWHEAEWHTLSVVPRRARDADTLSDSVCLSEEERADDAALQMASATE